MKSASLFVDTNQKPIAGYNFGPYWFGCNGRVISGLCTVKYKSEAELLGDYDSQFYGSDGGPGLTRVYSDGTKLTLRHSTEEIRAARKSPGSESLP